MGHCHIEQHIFLCGSVVVWKCVYLLCYFCVFFADFICIYAIFFVPLQSECTTQTVVSLIHKFGLFGKVCLGGLFVGSFVHLRDEARGLPTVQNHIHTRTLSVPCTQCH